MKTVVVTGGSSGIGKAICEAFSQKGFSVYELSRSGKDNGKIVHIDCDVTNEESVDAAFSKIADCTKKIDILVNNAGFGISGAAELTSLEQAKKQFDVNFFGTVACTNKAVKYMRESGGGCIVNISSLAAELSIPFQAFYSASKAAVNSLTLAMANELKPFGIKVCALMPGDVKTGFTAAREKDTSGDTLYRGILKKSVATMEHDEQNGMTPEEIAAAVCKLAVSKSPKPLSTVGAQYKLFASLAKLLPIRAVNSIIGMIYAR